MGILGKPVHALFMHILKTLKTSPENEYNFILRTSMINDIKYLSNRDWAICSRKNIYNHSHNHIDETRWLERWGPQRGGIRYRWCQGGRTH